MERDKKAHEEELKNAPPERRNELVCEFHQCTLREWEEWLTSIEDAELVKKAEKAGVYLDDIPLPEDHDQSIRSVKYTHFHYGEFGEKILDYDVRKTLRQNYRKKLPEYRKERREIIDLFIRGGGVFIGIIGGLTGLLAVYNKCGLGN